MQISWRRGEQGGWTTEIVDETKFLVLRGKEHGVSEGYCLVAPSTALEAVQTIEHVRRKTWFSAELLAGLVHSIFNELETRAIYPDAYVLRRSSPDSDERSRSGTEGGEG